MAKLDWIKANEKERSRKSSQPVSDGTEIKRQHAIHTCAKKIRERNPALTENQALIKAAAWLRSKDQPL